MTFTALLVLRRRAPVPALEAHGALLPGQRTYLGVEALEARHGALPEDVARVTAFAHAAGVEVLECDRRAAVMRLEGTWAALDAAFPGGRVPAALEPAVRWVFGPERPRARPVSNYWPRLPPGAELAESPPQEGALRHVSYTAPEVARFYEYPPLQGDGQCLGLLLLEGGYRESDLRAYCDALGLEPPEVVHVGVHTEAPSWIPNGEATLCLQLAAALCPRARLVLYHAPAPGLAGYFDVLCTAVFDAVNRPSVLSVSWSFPELEGQGPTREEAALFDELFRLAALQGITVCSSCGDVGGATPVIQSGLATLAPAANFPATSPHVLGCGGTTLHAGPGGPSHETEWNRLDELALWLPVDGSVTETFSFPMATGGGVSRMFPLPGYQLGAAVPPAVLRVWKRFVLLRTERFAGRGTPDVAANADLLTGYRVYFEGEWCSGGGTSAAAPMWAALVLLLNQGLARHQGPQVRVGWLNPLLYRLRVEEGAAIVRPVEGQAWSPRTGLGSPRGLALARALGAWPAEEVAVSPGTRPPER